MASACPPSLEDSFGPSVDACRRSFDFTLLFEQSILTIPLLAITLPTSLWRAWQLHARKPRVAGKCLAMFKLILLLALIAMQLALVIFWSTARSGKTKASIPSSSLALVVTLALVPLSRLEHTRSIRPSPLICTYLLASSVCDLTLVRTLWLVIPGSTITILFSAAFSTKVALLILEAVHKTHFLIHEVDIAQGYEAKNGVISRSFFFWLNKLLYTGYRKALLIEDLDPTPCEASPELLEASLAKKWVQYYSIQRHRLLLVTARVLVFRLFSAVLPRLCMIGFTVCQPLLLLRMINFLNDKTSSLEIGYGLLGAYAIVYTGIAVSTAWYEHQHLKFITAVRAGLVALIYNKTTSLSISAINRSAAVTLMSADVEAIVVGLRTIHDVWANFVQIAIAAWLLEIQTGVAVVASLVVSMACAFGATYLGAQAGKKRMEWMRRIEKRIDVTSGTLSSMRGVKLSGLTEILMTMIQRLRTSELQAAAHFRWWTIGAMMMGFIPVMISPVLTFAIFIAVAHSQGRTLDTARMFVSLSFLTLISQPLSDLLQSVPMIFSMVGCFDRIQSFMQTDQWNDQRQIEPSPTSKPSSSDGDHTSPVSILEKGVDIDAEEKQTSACSNVIEITGGDFSWEKSSNPVVKKIHLQIPYGSLVLCVGPVGCGKSTLLKAMLGEVPFSSGVVKVSTANIAYCDQTPWIMNGTLRENIAMFSDLEEPLYSTVLHACSLQQDLAQLPGGDGSNLGSKGITLSGGQKQRLSLARAIFARRDLNICDDILSGLDATTEMHVFSHVFGPNGIMRRNGRTVILATHAVHLLPYADYVVCMNSDGLIREQGTFLDLKAKGGYVSRLNISTTQSIPEVIWNPKSEDIQSSSTESTNERYKETKESQVTHSKPRGVYRFYINAVGQLKCFLYLALAIIYSFLYNFPLIWAKWWGEANEKQPRIRQAYYIGIYAMLQVLCLLSLGLLGWHAVIVVVSSGGRTLHWKLLSAALRAPLSYFEKTDTGTTLNRFSQDMQLLDSELPFALLNVFCSGLILLGQLLLIINASYYLAISFPVIFVVLWILQRIYLRTSRRLRHLELEYKSPIYSQFLESLDGLATIRAYSWTPNFKTLNYTRLEMSQRPFYLIFCLQRWLTLVLDCFSAGLAVVVVGLCIALRDKVSVGFAAVALNNMISLSGLMSNLVLVWVRLETSIASIERVKDFAQDTPEEALGSHSPPENWPDEGRVEFRNYTATYRDGETEALRKLNMNILPGEKIGVCGRTGSGKTSLMLSLFNMIAVGQGSIHIDGLEIAAISPERLRSALNAIPQEPYFLDGTVRTNADPYGTKTDEEILRAVAAVHLTSLMQSQAGLDTVLANDTLSHGEKQLFCLARAILKGCKIVVLDEATSNIDVETEKLIRDTIDQEFKGCTVITIAHRLETILKSDKIAVLEAGELIEFEKPEVLLGKDSMFKQLYETYR